MLSAQTNALHRFRQLGLVLLFVLLLGQASLLVHKVTVDHSSDSACALCTSLDRFPVVPATAPAAQFSVAVVLLAVAPDDSIHSLAPVLGRLARGPPAL